MGKSKLRVTRYGIDDKLSIERSECVTGHKGKYVAFELQIKTVI